MEHAVVNICGRFINVKRDIIKQSSERSFSIYHYDLS